MSSTTTEKVADASSSVVAVRPVSDVSSSASEGDHGSLPALPSDPMVKMRSILYSLPFESQQQILKRYYDELLTVRLVAGLSSTHITHGQQIVAEVACTLKILPPELRLKIFKYALPTEWDGKVPSLIKALRPVKKLYNEALALFFTRSKKFKLHEANDWKFGDMSDQALLTVGSVSISLKDGIYDPRLPNNPRPDLFYLRKAFPRCKRIRRVRVLVPWGNGGFWPLLDDDYVAKLLVGLDSLYQVLFLIPNTIMTQHLLGCLRSSSTQGIIEHTNKALKASATLSRVGIHPDLPEPIILETLYDGSQQEHEFAYIEDEDREGWKEYQPLARMDTWIWRAGKGKYLEEVL